jgi:hypothetical protein
MPSRRGDCASAEISVRRSAVRASGLDAGATATLTFHLLVALLEKAFAFAILALGFRLAGFLLHAALRNFSDPCYALKAGKATAKMQDPDAAGCAGWTARKRGGILSADFQWRWSCVTGQYRLFWP